MFSGISSYIWGGQGNESSSNPRAGQRATSPDVQETAIPVEPGTDEWILIDVHKKSSESKSSSDSSSTSANAKQSTAAIGGQRKTQVKSHGPSKKGPRSVSDKPVLVPNLRFVSTHKRIKSRKVKGFKKEEEFVEVATIPVGPKSSSSTSSDNDDRPSYAAMAKAPKAKEEEEKNDATVSVFQELKPLPRIIVKDVPKRKSKRSPTEKGNGLMEGSWFVTPPPCFTKPNTFSLAASPEEDSLIEHPSISGSINSSSYCNKYGSNNFTSSNSSTPLISSPQDSPMTISTNSSPNHSPPVSPMVINRNGDHRRSKVASNLDDAFASKAAEDENVPTPEKEIIQADIRALARRTLSLRSRSNRFAELEKQEEEGHFSSGTTGQVMVSPSVAPTIIEQQPLVTDQCSMIKSSEVFFGPENEVDSEDGDSIDTTESLVSEDGNESDSYDLDELRRPYLAENLSNLNIVSRMDRKGRGRSKKVSKARKVGKTVDKENDENNGEDGQVTKRSSSSERAHAALLAQTRSLAYEPVVQESLRQVHRVQPYLKPSFLDRSNKTLRSLNRHPTRKSKVAAMHNNYSCNRKTTAT